MVFVILKADGIIDMKVAVLGLGPSLSHYTGEDYDLSIGVNDIWRKVKTEVVVCLDHAKIFKPDRLRWINECIPVAFFSQIVNWDTKKGFENISFKMHYPSSTVDLYSKKYEKSYCSPFVACQIAFREYGAEEIHLFGVDMTNHPHLNPHICTKIKHHFVLLKQALEKEGCKFVVHGDGILKGI